MSSALKSFGKRARSVESQHRRLARGYRTKVDKNGNITHRPMSKLRFLNPLRFFPLIAVFLAFKGFLLSRLGPEAYSAHLDTLASGNAVERVGATLMSIDPITRTVVEVVSSTL